MTTFTQEQVNLAHFKISRLMTNLDRLYPIVNAQGQLPSPEANIKIVSVMINNILQEVFLGNKPGVEASKEEAK